MVLMQIIPKQIILWIANSRWYLNATKSAFKPAPTDQASRKNANHAHIKSSQSSWSQEVGYLWFGILICLLLFFWWLYLCLRLPTQNNPVHGMRQDPMRRNSQSFVNQATKSLHANSILALEAAQRLAPSHGLESSQMTTILSDTVTDRANKIRTQKIASAPRSPTIQAQWGLLNIVKTEQTDSVLQANDALNASNQCDDVEICDINYRSDIHIDTE